MTGILVGRLSNKFRLWGKTESPPRHRIPPIADMAWGSFLRVDELARRIRGSCVHCDTGHIRTRWWRRGAHSRGQFTVPELVAELKKSGPFWTITPKGHYEMDNVRIYMPGKPGYKYGTLSIEAPNTLTQIPVR